MPCGGGTKEAQSDLPDPHTFFLPNSGHFLFCFLPPHICVAWCDFQLLERLSFVSQTQRFLNDMLTGIGNDGIGELTGDSCIWMSSVIIHSNLSGVIYGSIVMAINEQ